MTVNQHQLQKWNVLITYVITLRWRCSRWVGGARPSPNQRSLGNASLPSCYLVVSFKSNCNQVATAAVGLYALFRPLPLAERKWASVSLIMWSHFGRLHPLVGYVG